MAKKTKKLGRSLLAGEVTLDELRKLTKQFATAKHYLRDELATFVNDTVVVDGDLVIAGDFDTFAHKLCRLLVVGSLKVRNLYRDHEDPETAVFVLRDLEAQRAITNGALCVGGNVHVAETLVGYYNDHCAEIAGSVTARVFAPENHHFSIGGALTADHVVGSGAEYRVSPKHKKAATPVDGATLRTLLVPGVLEGLDSDDDDDVYVDHSELRKHVAAGKPILAKAKPKPKARPKRR